MKIDLWMEGFAATGNWENAQYLGEYEGNNLMEAYLKHVEYQYKGNPPDYVSLDKPRIWGCRVFDNESEARQSFG